MAGLNCIGPIGGSKGGGGAVPRGGPLDPVFMTSTYIELAFNLPPLPSLFKREYWLIFVVGPSG